MKKYLPSPSWIGISLLVILEVWAFYGIKAPEPFHQYFSWCGNYECGVFIIVTVGIVFWGFIGLIWALEKYDTWRKS